MSEPRCLNEALRLIKLGYPIIPCDPGGKEPIGELVPNGLKNATRSETIVRSWFTAEPNANIAIETSGLCVVDVDPKDGEPNPWLEQIDGLETPMSSVSPRGGIHLVFADPTGTMRNSSSKVAPNVDIRANGGYVLVSPSVVNGNQYQWTAGPVSNEELPPAPEWLVTKASQPKERKAKESAPRATYRPTGVMERAEKYLLAMGPANSVDCGGRKTFLAAQHMVRGFELTNSEAFDVMSASWNQSCDPPWTDAELRHKIESAREDGDTVEFGEHLRDNGPAVDLSAILSPHPDTEVERVQTAKKVKTPDPGPFPKELLIVPGFVGAVMAHNLSTAFKPQPELALAASLALQAVLSARKITDDRGTRTNLQLLGICDSGGGKEFGRQLNEAILTTSGQSDLIGPEDIASDSGLLRHVELHPASLVQLDEIGKFLESMRNPKAGSWLKGIMALLLKLFSKSCGTYHGKAYADENKRVVIDQPCLVVYGTTVKESFVAGLTTEAITDGYLARQLVIEASNGDPDEQFVPSQSIPQAVIDRAIQWREFNRTGNLISEHPSPVIVPRDQEACEIVRDLNDRARAMRQKRPGPEATLWTRVVEKAGQLALVYAASRGPDELVIDGQAMRWAADVAWYLTERMAWLAYAYIAENEYESSCLRVGRIIRESGASGITTTELHLRTRWLKTKDRHEILTALIDRGEVVTDTRTSNGRPANILKSADFFTSLHGSDVNREEEQKSESTKHTVM